MTGLLISSLLIVIVLIYTVDSSSIQKTKYRRSEKVIIDTDGGGDDIDAILLTLNAWKHHLSHFEVIGITCSYGNTDLDNVVKNVLEALTIADTPFIPVYRGAHKSLADNFSSDHFFGEDGFGDFKFDKEITAKVDESIPAAVALINYASEHRGELNILVIGPQTNIAMAMRLDPEFVNNVKRFYIMGASVMGLGNVQPGKEFNFLMDPVSAYISLSSINKKPCLLFPWDTVVIANVTRAWRVDVLGKKTSEIVQFINKGEAIALSHNSPIWSAADMMCAAVMMWPDLITKSFTCNVSPVKSGKGKGVVMVDYLGTSGEFPNAEIVQSLKVVVYKERVLQLFSQ